MHWRAIVLGALFAVEAAASPPLMDGQRVKIRGDFAGQRVIAKTIDQKDAEDRDLEIVGRVESLDGDGRIQIHGAWAVVEEDELSRRARQWVHRLEPGDWVKVEGAWQNSGELWVDSVERPRKKGRVDTVEGLVRQVAATAEAGPMFRVGPFSVELRPSTHWVGFE